MDNTLDKTKTSSKNILNDRMTIVYAEMAPSKDKITPDPSTSTETSESSEDSSTTLGSTSSPSESMKRLLEKLDDDREKEYHIGYEPVWRTMSTTDGSKMETLDYFRSHRIFQLFTFLISHLLAECPDDPIDFLISLVDRCLAYRDRGADPPLLFEDRHVLSVYTALDPLGEGQVRYNQYATGMTTMGLADFNLLPDDMDDTEVIMKETFLQEAKQALLDQLDWMLGSPQPHTAVSVDNTLRDAEDKTTPSGTRSEEIMSRLYASPGTSAGEDQLSTKSDASSFVPSFLSKKSPMPRSLGTITASIASTVSLKSLKL